MSTVNLIREMKKDGFRISEIARETGCDPKTVRKYIQQDDFSPKLPVVQERKSNLDPYKPIIDEWLEKDKEVWYKQQHTAKRIFERLHDEHGYRGSYPIVQRYVKKKRRQRKAQTFQDLMWSPGTMQVDFGQADFMMQGENVRLHYLVCTFPYSNVAYAQVFGGETSECVCQGMKNVFEHIGGVPNKIIFDNATGIGRKTKDGCVLTELFERFKAHYGFRAIFCNPNSGHEKGAVEASVGALRRNIFVPIRAIDDIPTYNSGLFEQCEAYCSKPHYRKQKQQMELFEEDVKVLGALPKKRFDVLRFELHKTDSKGMIQVDGSHFYSTRPDLGKTHVHVVVTAYNIEIRLENGEIVGMHKRIFGKKRTYSQDPACALNDLRKKPGAWEESSIRRSATDELRAYVDTLSLQEKRSFLHVWNEVSTTFGFDESSKVMDWFARSGVAPQSWNAMAVAERMNGFGMDTPPEPGQSLAGYDALLQGTVVTERRN